mmetsp:Transcript_123321/g.356377  ORF Transcript_123321/g.356377 Transcript_123321/m.356377 type:complete len:302 (-) Transcript_123321:926-1831(-)
MPPADMIDQDLDVFYADELQHLQHRTHQQVAAKCRRPYTLLEGTEQRSEKAALHQVFVVGLVLATDGGLQQPNGRQLQEPLRCGQEAQSVLHNSMPHDVDPRSEAMVHHGERQQLARELLTEKAALIPDVFRVTPQGNGELVQDATVVEGVQALVSLSRLEEGDIHDEFEELRHLALHSLVVPLVHCADQGAEQRAAVGAPLGGQEAPKVGGVVLRREQQQLHADGRLRAGRRLAEEGHQQGEHAMSHQLLVESLPLAGSDLLRQAADILQELKALLVLLPDLDEELLQQAVTLLQIVQNC